MLESPECELHGALKGGGLRHSIIEVPFFFSVDFIPSRYEEVALIWISLRHFPFIPLTKIITMSFFCYYRYTLIALLFMIIQYNSQLFLISLLPRLSFLHPFPLTTFISLFLFLNIFLKAVFFSYLVFFSSLPQLSLTFPIVCPSSSRLPFCPPAFSPLKSNNFHYLHFFLLSLFIERLLNPFLILFFSLPPLLLTFFPLSLHFLQDSSTSSHFIFPFYSF